ncbi:Gfo/Idh/MocA family protein [Flavihumibacter petaseus]|uniref:Putative glucose--fructose oxidoreductase n=1 Tax=Flavihumibacter petaseus NBRC 106054 TaxID=1220578 RepID=A0A0E9MWG6_9BACT|nr:Gfo/Idh/MocA family oxidoreductase [Flavihumibacter petaseus]GAO41781.1 putative glucose--fructose oxidoreductase [Flavihumibacter petaseus NBRC 106054]
MRAISRKQFLSNISIYAVGAAVPFITKAKIPPARKLNIALVGLGRYANILADGLLVAQHCRLAGIVTGTPEKAKDWKKRFNLDDKNIYNYQNFDQIASNKDIDLVYVVTPNALHKEYVLRAAKAGKHVIVEKPIGISVEEARDMITACEKAGVQLAMGYRLHYEPYNMEMKRMGQERIFGKVKLVEASLGYKAISNPGEWRLHKALSGGGPLMNLGVYCVQAGRYITGEEPISVTAQYGPVTYPDIFKEVEESITWQLQFPSGAICTSSSSYNCGIDRLYAAADEGFFELSPAISYGPFQGRTSNGPLKFPETNQQAVQMDEIAKVILAGKRLPDHISGLEGLLDMKVLMAIYQAADSGKKIAITPEKQ